MDLLEFLTARYDEEEALTRAVQDRSAPFDGQWKNDDNRALRTFNDWVLAYKPDAKPGAWRPGPHRVLGSGSCARRHRGQAGNRRGVPAALRGPRPGGPVSTRADRSDGARAGDARLPDLDHRDADPAWRTDG